MIGYVTMGTNDLVRAAKFYDALFAELGGKRTLERSVHLVVGRSAARHGSSSRRRQSGDAGNGAMVALAADSQEKVKAVYAQAMKLGAKDEAARASLGTFYAAYFRDLDGNKLNVFHFPG